MTVRRNLLSLTVIITVAITAAVACGAGTDSPAAPRGDSVANHEHQGTNGAQLTPPPPPPKPGTAVVANEATRNVYAHTGAGDLSQTARAARPLVYVPNSNGDTVTVVDARTYKIIDTYRTGRNPQHVVPGYDLKTLYVTNDLGNSLTPIDPTTGRRAGGTFHIDDPYNMYFTPDGKYALVVAEARQRLDFYDRHTWRLRKEVHVDCPGVDHVDFSADSSFFVATCEFSGKLVRVDMRTLSVTGYLRVGSMPQDIKLDPEGEVFYVADMMSNGVYVIDAARFRLLGFLRTGRGAHGIYPSRDATKLYVSNRGEGSVSVIDVDTRRVATTWRLPGGGSPDMGGVSADGGTLWLTGRYNNELYAISTKDGRLLARIKVGSGPHGACVWPQPGRYSLGHTGILR